MADRLPHPENRSPHSAANRFMRAAWGVAWLTLFRPSPRIAHGWRNLLLRLFGARLHPTARVYRTAKVWGPWNLEMHERACIGDHVDVYCVDRIAIGSNSTVSQYSYLCGATHDYEDPAHPLVPKPIVIGSGVWIAADVFVGPGVTIADGTVVGVRSTVLRDLPEWVVAAGTPAQPIRARTMKSATPVPHGQESVGFSGVSPS